MSVRDDGLIQINGFTYKLNGRLIEKYISRLPAKVNIGSDSYDKEQFLSNWVQKDHRGGILIDEMDESVHSDRCWWTNCIISYDGHLTLPRLATEITALPTHTASDYNNAKNWRDPSSHWTDEANAIDGATGTYASCALGSGSAWQDFIYIYVPSISCTQVRFYWNESLANRVGDVDLDVYYNGAWAHVYTAGGAGGDGRGAYSVKTLGATYTVTAARLRFKDNGAGGTGYLNSIQFYATTATAQGTFLKFANFNGEKYYAQGNFLAKLDSGRASYSFVGATLTTITDIIPSLNSRLYIFNGDTEYYWYMSTAEAFVKSTTGSAYWGIENEGLLYKLASDGTWASSSDPDGATPTWNNLKDITTDVSGIEGVFRGRDASGNPVVYCAGNTYQQIYDATNDLWYTTDVKLPNHPNGGKGAAYWNDGHYFSYGLGVKKYTTGTTATITDVGLNRDGGLPLEYNGEIIKFYGNTECLFALVDASQTTGNSQSGLYAWNGRAWECWWVDSSNDGAMHDVILSSAESGYAAYWDCGGTIFYIDIPRGNTNPLRTEILTAYQSYTTGDDEYINIYGAVWASQTFTPSSDHTVTRVGIKICNQITGFPPRTPPNYTINVSIYATSSNKPTGSALCTGSLSTAELSYFTVMHYFDLGDGTALTAATKYAIVVSVPDAALSTRISWACDDSSATYSGGNGCSSTDSGANWTTQTYDFIFEEFGGTGTQKYESSGIFISPWFDAGNAASNKLAKRFTTYARGITTTETVTIKYRINKQITDRDNGWNTLETLNTAAENGPNEEVFGSGEGLKYSSIQYRLDFARGTTEIFSPDIMSQVMAYSILTKGNRAWTIPISIIGEPNETTKQQYDNLWACLQSESLIPIIIRSDGTTYYVYLMLRSGTTQTGDHYTGEFVLDAVEV